MPVNRYVGSAQVLKRYRGSTLIFDPVVAASAWDITDNGDGTFDIVSAPAASAQTLTLADNGDGTFNIS